MSAISESATLAVDAKAKALKAAGRPVIGFGAGEPRTRQVSARGARIGGSSTLILRPTRKLLSSNGKIRVLARGVVPPGDARTRRPDTFAFHRADAFGSTQGVRSAYTLVVATVGQ